MRSLAAPLSAVALAGMALNPAMLAHLHSSSTTPQAPLMAAVAASQGPTWLNTAKNSVLRIEMEFDGTLSIPAYRFNQASGTFVPASGPTQQIPVTAYYGGSGFVVDPSGYIVTNAHVVDESATAVSDALWSQYQQDASDYFANTYPTLTQDQLTSLTNTYLQYVGSNSSWGPTTYHLVVFNPAKTDAAGDITKLMAEGWSAEVKKEGQPYPEIGKDVAIIKIEPEQPLVALPLASSAALVSGTSIYVIGFPGVADFSNKSLLVPSITSGIVSALKPSDLGDYNIIQMDATVDNGNSGGPVLNAQGQVVGIATLKTSDSDLSNWALPIELAQEYLNELNVKPAAPAPALGMFAFIYKLPLMAWAAIAGVLLLIICGLGLLVFKRRHHLPPPPPPPPPQPLPHMPPPPPPAPMPGVPPLPPAPPHI